VDIVCIERLGGLLKSYHRLARNQAYRDFLDELWLGDSFSATGFRQPKMA
jgi:hypothetical protein